MYPLHSISSMGRAAIKRAMQDTQHEAINIDLPDPHQMGKVVENLWAGTAGGAAVVVEP